MKDWIKEERIGELFVAFEANPNAKTREAFLVELESLLNEAGYSGPYEPAPEMTGFLADLVKVTLKNGKSMLAENFTRNNSLIARLKGKR